MITSYSQNLEDVMLYRVLKHIDKGFYVDIGAGDPLVNSVTKLFYDMGWHGINVEPVEDAYNELVEKRPRDINIRATISDYNGVMPLYHVTDFSEISTTNRMTAWTLQLRGHHVKKIDTRCYTLDNIIATCNVKKIHFLKIDVEGEEANIINGFSFKVRPWIIVVEALDYLTKNKNTPYEDRIKSFDYSLVYEDGLNQFYLANEHKELKPLFRYPVNISDSYVRNMESVAMQVRVFYENNPIWRVTMMLSKIKRRLYLLKNYHTIKGEHNILSSEWKIDAPWYLSRIYGHKILDTGFISHNAFTKCLCRMGYNVIGVDKDMWRYYWKADNFTYKRLDLSTQADSLPKFTTIISPSFIEHQGLGWYGEQAKGDHVDRVVFIRLMDLLEENGYLLMQVPYGKRDCVILDNLSRPFYRVYSEAGIKKLVHGYNVEEYSYGAYVNRRWQVVEKQVADNIDYVTGDPLCIV